jgi:predicted SAM-dependent methyltransferase
MVTNLKKTLNIGCGERIYTEYPEGHICINLDQRSDLKGVNVIGSAKDILFEDESFNYILASDIIEHFPISETLDILKEWYRLLKFNGILEFRTPDMAWVAKHYTENKDAKFVSYHIFGGQNYPGNFHYVIFDSVWLTDLCKEVGFTYLDCVSDHSNFILKVIK